MTGTSFTLPSGSELTNGETYRFWFGANNANGYSAWTAPHNFTVGAPALVIPAAPSVTGTSDSGFGAARPQINWTAVSGATSYSIWLVYENDRTLVSGATGLTTNSFTPSTDLANGRYSILVRSANAAGLSPWSGSFAFDVAPAATLKIESDPETAVLAASDEVSSGIALLLAASDDLSQPDSGTAVDWQDEPESTKEYATFAQDTPRSRVSDSQDEQLDAIPTGASHASLSNALVDAVLETWLDLDLVEIELGSPMDNQS